MHSLATGIPTLHTLCMYPPKHKGVVDGHTDQRLHRDCIACSLSLNFHVQVVHWPVKGCMGQQCPTRSTRKRSKHPVGQPACKLQPHLPHRHCLWHHQPSAQWGSSTGHQPSCLSCLYLQKVLSCI